MQLHSETQSVLLERPRKINPALTFDGLVKNVEEIVVRENAPGLIVSISGTDSILTFLVCAQALENLGRQDRLVGIHYAGPEPSAERMAEQLTISPNFMWESRVAVPWLRAQAPDATLIVDYSDVNRSDNQRWANLADRAVTDVETWQPLPAGKNFWVVGTRNETEQALGSYSNISTIASLQPILPLWKSEVLEICKLKDVPRVAINMSCTEDCACGRDSLLPAFYGVTDALLMIKAGIVSPQYRQQLEPKYSDVLGAIEQEIDRQRGVAAFKGRIPYVTSSDVVVLANG